MKPYYHDEQYGITIYHGDCRDILPHLEPVDLVLTSPPYGNLREYGGHPFDWKTTINSIVPIIKVGGVCVWVVGDETIDGSESGESFRQTLYFLSKGLKLHDTMIYEKAGFSSPSNNRYHQIFEYMFVLCNDYVSTFNGIKDKKNTWDSWGKNTKRQIDGQLKDLGKRKGMTDYGLRYNVWRYVIGAGNSSPDAIAFDHPAIFPEKLATDHIVSWSNQNDTVLDPMCGSGTTLKIAKALGRKAIGIEIEKKYCDIAIERLRQGVLEL
jgi:DNA modification methylase